MDPHRRTRVDARLKQGFESGTLPRELLICGPAGTGKTFGALTVLHTLAADYPKLRILCCRQTRASLTESVCVTFEQEVLPADGMESIAGGATRRNRLSYVYPNGSEIVLGGLDKPSRITSTAWDLIFVNEAIELTEEGWETLGSRLNRPGRDPRFGYLLGDTNPGDPSHFLKKRSETGGTALWDTAHEANPAIYSDGAYTAGGLAYLERLARLRGTRRKRYLEGLWVPGEGQWFETFGEQHESIWAEYDPAYPVHLAIDSGVHSGAVWFQVRDGDDGPIICAFGDFYSYNLPAYQVGLAIVAKGAELCGGRYDFGTTDPAGKAANPIGPTVKGELERAGLKRLESWPSYPGSVRDGLSLIESFVAIDPPGLLIHPRCEHLKAAFGSYLRAKRGGQFIDVPVDPQHPHEDLLDAFRGGMQAKFPEGRRPEVKFHRTARVRSIF